MTTSTNVDREAVATDIVVLEPAVEDASLEHSEEALEFQPFEEGVYEWLTTTSIPGAYPPMWYIGPWIMEKILRILGRSLTTLEAKRLVQADGPMRTCNLTGVDFQPVVYIKYCPRTLQKEIQEEEKTLLEANLEFGGHFFFVGGKAIAVSGSPYTYRAREEVYEDAGNSSPLVIQAQEMKKIDGRMRWGVTLEEIERVQEKKDLVKAIREKARENAHQMTSHRNHRQQKGFNLNPVLSEVFSNPKKVKRVPKKDRDPDDVESSKICKDRPSRHHKGKKKDKKERK